VARADEPQPQRAPGCRRRQGAVAELAVETEVDVQPQVVVAVEEVLAPRVRGAEHATVEQACAVLEPALRAVGGHGLADEQPGVAAGEAVDGVTLWHALIVADTSNRGAARTGVLAPASMEP
jgi:hypothetical protein